MMVMVVSTLLAVTRFNGLTRFRSSRNPIPLTVANWIDVVVLGRLDKELGGVFTAHQTQRMQGIGAQEDIFGLGNLFGEHGQNHVLPFAEFGKGHGQVGVIAHKLRVAPVNEFPHLLQWRDTLEVADHAQG